MQKAPLFWHIKSFHQLRPEELYELFVLRINVFVVEQNCPYPDADGKDYKSLHLFATNAEGRVVACARLVKPGVSYTEWSIGRVATSMEVRGTGIGRELMERAIRCLEEEHACEAIRISAQSYLKKFYGDLGFEQVSEEYLEDDIPHIEMLRLRRSIN
jgi:ElaA protein